MDVEETTTASTTTSTASTTKKDYRYFSPQDTFAKITSSFSKPSQGLIAQILIRHGAGGGDYRRLPSTMRVYEAISKNFLTNPNDQHQINTLIIRWSQDNDDIELFPSVLDTDDNNDTNLATAQDDTPMVDAEQVATISELVDQEKQQASTNTSSDGDGYIVDDNLANVIRILDEANTKGKKVKKSSAAMLKVRNMQIKSKAKGDKKRIPKVEDRFFMEVIMIDSHDDDNKATGSFQFLARKDPMERILQNVVTSSSTSTSAKAAVNWEFFIPKSEGDGCDSNSNKFSLVDDTSCSLDKMEKDGIFKCFDRLIIRQRKE